MIPVTINGEETFVRVGDKDWTKANGKWRFNTGTVVSRDITRTLEQRLIAQRIAGLKGESLTTKRDIILYGYAETPEAIKAVENYINANR